MPRDREPPTLADYAITALSPALIMGLVGSLAFFLLEVAYQGWYSGKLAWTLFFFVFGAVLVARIAITIDTSRAWLYGLALGAAVFLALTRFMEYPAGSSLQVFGALINLMLVVVVSWSANKLTWDCTHIDEKQEDAGRGLMTAVGNQLSTLGPNPGADDNEDADAPKSALDVPRSKKPVGTWVVYFSLAALPLFGLGQSLIPPADAGRRQYAFWLLVVYVACGLGLLLTTSFLGVRRYLRQRKQPMPPAMAAVWLGSGAALIVGFLLLGAVIPRPYDEYPLISGFTPLGAPERGASDYAMRDGEAGKGDGKPGADAKEESKDAKDGAGGKGQAGGKSEGKTGRPEGSSKDGEDSDQSKGSADDGKQGRSESSKQKGRDANAKGKGDRDKTKAEGKSNGGGASGEPKSRDSRGTERSSPSDLTPPSALTSLGEVLRKVVLIILVIGIVAFAIWFALKHLSSAHQWARDLLASLAAFWQSLFGGRRRTETADDDEEMPVAVVPRPRPFATFRNPFDDGSAAGRSPEELTRYSFAALEAWAFERDVARADGETPLEFAGRLAGTAPGVAEGARAIAGLYARMAYGRRRLPDTSRAAIEQFWRGLEAADGQRVPG